MRLALPIALALVVLSLNFAPPAQAVPLTVNFTVQGAWNDAVYGDLTGSGTFTFDSSLMHGVHRPNGLNISALSFNWASSNWTTVNADADFLRADSLGALESWRIGGDIGQIAGVGGGTFDFMLQTGTFWYSYAGAGDVYFGTLTSWFVFQNTAPLADAGGPYSGVTGYPVTMTGTGSQDPDGYELSYTWSFGDGQSANGETVSHGYSSSGTYNVRLFVNDGALYDDDGTTAMIVDALGFDAIVTGGDRVLRLESPRSLCITAEAKDFPIEQVNVSSIELAYGSSTIRAVGEETSLGGDRDQDGRQEVSACFTKHDLRHLFAELQPGTNEITATLLAKHQAGYPISGNVLLAVGSPSLSVSPNPVRPNGTITFTKSAPGVTRVQLLDVSGRLVRTILDAELGVGVQSIPFVARDRAGSPLASGVYFLRISDQEGVRSRSVVIAK